MTVNFKATKQVQKETIFSFREIESTWREIPITIPPLFNLLLRLLYFTRSSRDRKVNHLAMAEHCGLGLRVARDPATRLVIIDGLASGGPADRSGGMTAPILAISSGKRVAALHPIFCAE